MTWLEVYNVFFGGGGEPIPNEKDACMLTPPPSILSSSPSSIIFSYKTARLILMVLDIDLGRCYTDLQSAMIRFLEPQFPVFAAQFLESEEYHKVAAQHYIDLKNHGKKTPILRAKHSLLERRRLTNCLE